MGNVEYTVMAESAEGQTIAVTGGVGGERYLDAEYIYRGWLNHSCRAKKVRRSEILSHTEIRVNMQNFRVEWGDNVRPKPSPHLFGVL
jgi:hypothetical protein